MNALNKIKIFIAALANVKKLSHMGGTWGEMSGQAGGKAIY
ncbi:MAG: hypothetical protein OXU76_03945 [Alphaproteobacteria bacterium]|nr:hypothetical protein [Alphaproteobacteria bacterium]